MENIVPQSLQLLVNTVQELSLARDLDTVMKIVRSAARRLTGADGATFVLREEDRCYYADEDAIAPLWKGNRFPMSACISGWVMVNRQAVTIEDIYIDNRIPAAAYRPTFVKSLAMVPIRTIDPIGAIGNYWSVQRQPSPNEVWLLQSLADITAVTMENVRLYHELEQRVKERTAELEFMNQELEAFSYSVSHDLRAPLRALTGYAGFILDDSAGKLDAETHRMLNNITASAGNMNRLIDALMHFFKTSKMAPRCSEVDTAPLVEKIVQELLQANPGRQIAVTVNPLPAVQADPLLLQQVWYNLLSNAFKYTGATQAATVYIGAREENQEIIFEVKDNGAGFSMNYAHKLFQVFQRLHTADEFEGTGVGLATVKRIVNRHGGRIWAEAVPGAGASFYFTLPAAGRQPPPDPRL